MTLIVILASATAFAADDPRSADVRALIISIDGLRGDWAAHPDRNNLKLPTLGKLAARGARADAVRGVFPTVTYPSHTTLITGCRPARHGILANTVFTPPTEPPTGRWYWDFKDIQVPTLIDAARAAGWSTAAVGWPVTVGAPADVLFPEVWAPGRFDDAFVEISRHCRPADLIPSVLTRYDLGMGSGRDVSLTNVARLIVDQYKPRLMLVHLVELDSAEHQFGPDSAEAREAAQRSDRHVAEILERYEKAGLLDKTVVAIVSDHGFLPIRRSFHVNALLAKQGLIRPGDKPDDPARDFDAVGWIAGGSCAILLKKPDDDATLARVRAALAPFTGKPDAPIRRILERAEITAVGSNPRAALMLDAGDGWTFGTRLTGEIETDSTTGDHPLRGMHGQMPDRPDLESAFIAAGPGITLGATISEMKMIDIAPTLAEAFGLSLPDAEGREVRAVLQAATSQPADPGPKK